MFVGVEKVISELTEDYTVVTRQCSWEGSTYAFHDGPDSSYLVKVKLTNVHTSDWNYRIRKKWFFFKSAQYLEVQPHEGSKLDFNFECGLFKAYQHSGSAKSGGCEITAVYAIGYTKLARKLTQLGCRLTHAIASTGEVVGYLFLPDSDEYSDSKRFPICILARDLNVSSVHPLLIAFCQSQEFGRHSSSSSGYCP